MNFLPASFQNRLALLFGGLALVVGLPTAYLVNSAYSTQLVADRSQSLHDLAQSIASVLSENLRDRQRDIDFLAGQPYFREADNSAIHSAFQGLQSAHPYYTWIGFADLSGVVRAATGNVLVGATVAQRPWFIQGRGQRFVGDLHEALLLAKHLPVVPGMGPVRFLDFAAPVTDPSGRIRGVVAAHVHWQWAEETIRHMVPHHAESSRLEILIVNAKDQVIYPEKPLAEAPVRLHGSDESSLQPPAYLMAAAPIREVIADNPLGWRVIVRQPREEALRDVAALHRTQVLSALLAAGVFLALAWWSASLVSRPLRRLAEQAKNIEQGDEALRLDITTNSSELAQLVTALRGMASTLIDSKNALAENNTVLEQRVLQRTAELERLNEDLRALARRDALTGIANRLAANERLREEFARMKRTGAVYAVLLFDIDFFKRINDTHGHEAGDQVLQQMAGTLASALRETDFVARFGGEEFIAVLPATALDNAVVAAEKIRQGIESAPADKVGRVTVSIGVAIAEAGDRDEDEAVRRADLRLYAAKHAGRNRVVWANDDGSDR